VAVEPVDGSHTYIGAFQPAVDERPTQPVRQTVEMRPVSGDRDDSHSLLLPSGSSAYSSTVCFAFGDWHLRFFAKNVGSSSGDLRVQVIVPSLLGILTILDGGTVSGNGTWTPSPRLQLALCNVTSLLGTRAVAFRFTPVGYGAAYQIDDVYLDPWKDT